MTQDEIIEMTREAGWSGIYSSWTSPTNRTSLTVPVTMQQIEAFANLVAAKEREALAQQEPVADDFFRMIADKNPKPFPPPQRTWAGLTDVEIDYLLGSTAGENEETHISFARAIEAKLKELNT